MVGLNDETLVDNDRVSVASSANVGDNGAADGASLDGKDTERATLAQHENAVVVWMKAFVFVVLVTTAIAVSSGLFLYTRNDQKRDFEHAFRADAAKLLESFQVTVKRTLEAVDAVSVTITSHSKETNATFPNVTLPDFEVRYANSRILSGSVFVEYLALVTDENRLGWEAYQIENRDHFDKALKSEVLLRQHQDRQYNNTQTRHLNIWSELNDQIVNMAADGSLSPAPKNSGPYLPLWQISPIPPSKALLNFNSYSHPSFAGAYKETVASGQAVIDVASNLAGEHLGDTGAFFKMLLVISQYRFDVEEYLGDPVSTFGYPVFDSFDLINRKVVGVVGTNFYWRLYLKDVLPPDTKGIICVLENTQGQMFTYRIDDTVKYLGQGDHHDKNYDYLEESSDIGSYISQILSPETKSYTSVDLNSDYCSYKLRVYPSSDTEDQYVNQDPIIIAMVIVSVFLFTSLVFILYTVAVARRQKVVMNRAVASSAIVSSLFPEQVRDEIYKENEGQKKTWQTSDASAEKNGCELGPSRPIAELYHHTTIMFADLVGFTAWSSTRNPVQVFELLETLYQAFDVIAVARKVFKVETIGDCYVAVAGLPKPQSNHAIIMARFAYDCIQKMRELVVELSQTLGSDTATLEMRVGLHSGSVTGGVLRGQKSRFQLFGDAMNLASRMESNGMSGRIHVSQETAEELTTKGKSSWLAPRDEKIFVKGKGEMQTYWVCPQAVAQSHDGSVLSGSAWSSDEKRDDVCEGLATVVEC